MKKLLKTGEILIKNCRLFGSKLRKYPVDPKHTDTLPVFQYNISKENYKRVFAWGNSCTGALGQKGIIDKEVTSLRYPKRLTFAEYNEVSTVAVGFGFTLFAVNSDTDVKLFGTGLNTDCQIGYHEVRKDHPLGVIFYPQSISLPFRQPKTSKIIKIAAGRAHSLVLTDEGVFTLGNNAYGQCGRKIIEDEDYSRSNFINHLENVDGERIVDVECGQDHSLLLTENGSVYSCGWGADGQTGHGHFKNTELFTKINSDIQNERIVKFASRSDFVIAVNDKGDAFGWGNTEYGQLTLPNDDQQLSIPTYIKMLSNCGKIVDAASGGSFCLAVNDQGETFTWGYGLLGVGPKVEQSREPKKIPDTLFGKNDFQPEAKVVRVKCGLNYAAAVNNFGDLFIWGRNRSACLGLGHEKDQYFPLKVSLAGTVEDVFCGLDHTVALCKPFI